MRLTPLLAPLLLAAAPAAAQSPHNRLFALFARSDAAMLQRHPLEALSRGDLTREGELGALFSDALDQADAAAMTADLAELQHIPRDSLNPTDRIAWDVFDTATRINLRGLADPALRTSFAVRPINHFFGFHLTFADIQSGQSIAPFKTAADYRASIARMRQFPAIIDRIIAHMRDGVRLGIVESQLTTRNMIEQLDTQLKGGVDASPYAAPLAHPPAGVSVADYRAAIGRDVLPALARLRAFLQADYLPHARAAVGLGAMKGGDKVYAYLIEQNTTLPLSAAEVHRIGLDEVARIRAAMTVAAKAAGFTGSLPELFTYMRTAKRFQPRSVDELRDGYLAIRRRLEATIPTQFSTLPRTPLEIRPTPEHRAKTSAGGDYEQGSADGTRPGVFHYNGYDLPSRYTWEMETLFLHEAEPGHHFQISLAMENQALPNFMRFGGNTAYVEGWALYAESLWRELGMEKDPWQRLGGLNDEMLRAMRLVVDTGIHAEGWSREQAIRYMLDNSPGSVTDMTAEVERYIAIPGQALAYKIGQLTIQREKAKAIAALGARFDPRAFHAQVLMTGALPMPVLERKLDEWIAGQRPQPGRVQR